MAEYNDNDFGTVDDVVKANECIGCLACVELCPQGKLQTNDDILPYPTPIVSQNCDGCGICLLECPAKFE